MEQYMYLLEGTTLTVILTIGLVILSQVLRSLSVKYIKNKKNKGDEDPRHTIYVIKNFINIVSLILFFILWGNEIQDFAISIAAFTVAIVLATKEILQAFLGFLYITSSRVFKVGDWIKIGDDIGEVGDISWSKTSILEINPDKYGFTGKTIFISNGLFFISNLQNLNFMRRYVHYSFSLIKDDVGINPYTIKEELIAKIKEHCNEFENIAERYNSLIENKLGIKMCNIKSKVSGLGTLCLK